MSAWKRIALLSLLPAMALGQAPASIRTSPGAAATPKASDQKPVEETGEVSPADLAAPADESPELGAPEGSATPLPQAGNVPPPDQYTVKSGDTLWDLSGRFLNNPWYWPKVWSYNPEITNPHWIYPGNVLRFYPSSEEAPTRVGPVAGAQADENADEESVRAPRELEDLSKGSIDKIEQLGDDDAVAVVGPYKIGYTAPKAANVRHDTFVTPSEFQESGTLTAAFEEKLLLWTTDRIYANFRGPAPVKVGQTYAIYKTDGTVVHPVTHELFGYKSSILGAAKVVAVDDQAATLVITQAFEPIERGHYLNPWSSKLVRRVAPRPNRRTLDGVIVASQSEVVTEIGEHHVVFVDKGLADGVEDGNTFQVVRSGDPYGQPPKIPQNDPSLPQEVVGSLLIIDAKEHASTALVRRSLRELLIGDHVMMRPAAGTVAAP